MRENSLRIRPVREEDLASAIALLQNLSNYVPPDEDLKTIWADFVDQERVFAVLAEIDGVPVGYGVVQIENKIRGGRVGHIEDVVTSNSARRIGVGRAIIERLLEISDSHDCYKTVLDCKDHNTGFYEACGFVKAGVAMQRLP